jgi:hypothetical protein
MVLQLVRSTTWQHARFHNLCPMIAVFRVRFKQEAPFDLREGFAPNRRIQLIEPSFAALFCEPAGQVSRYVSPVFVSMLGHQLHEQCIFLSRPTTS